MSDLSAAIAVKSDQLNADDLIAGPKTVTITRVAVVADKEQPVAIFYEGDNGKPYKPCKSMCRVMAQVWGIKPEYVGKSMTLFRDPTVKWGGLEVGGIRISHMSGLDEALVMPLTITRGNKKPFRVQPLKGAAPKSPPPPPPAAPPPPPKQDGGIDMGGDDDDPAGFPFTLQDRNGNEHVMRGDGAKWRDTLLGAMSKAFDQAKRTWEANEEYVKVAEEAGQTEFSRPVREKWEQRKVAAQGGGG